MKIYCFECKIESNCILTNGKEIYPHRIDLYDIPFWKCCTCENYVGCHHKTDNPTRPLGVIANKEMKNARQHIHRILDPLWKTKKMKRSKIYLKISDALGYNYHTAELSDINEARKVYKIIKGIWRQLNEYKI